VPADLVNQPIALTERRVAAAQDLELRQALHRFVSGRLRDRVLGEDIVQETYVRMYDYRRTRPIANAAAFCFAVARNLVHDHFRGLHAQPPASELVEDMACPRPWAEEVLDYRQRLEILVGALTAMPPLRREIFLRRRLDGVPSTVVAADLGMTVSAVDKHCTRALAYLRHTLARRGVSPGGAL
jgi:RNA polymerase sigma factor (sigma-70 family)